jgi:glycosyltransferase involved in cell wall biosynthesis
MKKKILISAYAISPVRGSEYAAAWNTVCNLAREHELWVLFGMSDDHMGDTQTLKHYIENSPVPSVTFVEVKASRLANAINLLNKAGFGWFFYFAYYLWQKEALKAAKKITETVDIDIVHQLGPIGYREPGFLTMLNKPMVWGPVGGMKIMDNRFISMLPVKAKMKFIAKNYINQIQLGYSGRIKTAFQKADVIIAATLAGQHNIRQRFGRDSFYLPEQGIANQSAPDAGKFHNIKQQVQLVWSGSLIERKNLKMCIDALAAVKQNNWALHVLGNGPLCNTLQKQVSEKGLSGNVTFYGHLPRTEAISLMANAHLHIITSIGEDNPAVIFEAMSNGVPTLTIDHCGMGDVICNKCGIKILPDNYDIMVKKMSSVLSHLFNNTNILIDMAKTTLICAEEHTADKRLKKLDIIYDEATRAHNSLRIYSEKEKILVAV